MVERPYNMTARAKSVDATRTRIMHAAVALFLEGGLEGIQLEEVAGRSRVSVQTVLRHFGSKQGLFTATVERMRSEVLRARDAGAGTDGSDALRTLLAVYEAFGEVNWQLLRQERREPAAAELLGEARQVHRSWLAKVFAGQLPRSGALRTRRLDLLFAATDFYVWKLYRWDLGYSRVRTLRLMRETLTTLCASFARSEER